MDIEDVGADRGEEPAGGAVDGQSRHMQVGVVADRLGLSIRTLHHWDEAGLVSPSARSAGGFRLYTEEDVDRLFTVRRMKPLGFTIEEMKQLLASLDALHDPSTSESEAAAARAFIAQCRQRAEESLTTLQQRLAWAVEFRDLLAALDTEQVRD
ncbi:MerR family transcriptional regulator [Auraticoccus sp. F435]|uniref:MerR family transcriptional regulator n=1 Tax=Auraticoccus cholistanensis TaxID=2656650 RepID=A0A6A9V2E9_9ACTN|nr:MerR family transcriptional regulator [Auraticoccus cholistanensis]MVA77767.1 MerR family transcriptional regulator [Auraticoccus cholistanensis]